MDYTRGLHFGCTESKVFAEFSCQHRKTQLPVVLVILKTLISLFWCVRLGLELKFAGLSRTTVPDPWARPFFFLLCTCCMSPPYNMSNSDYNSLGQSSMN